MSGGKERKLLWFFGLWCAGVLAVSVVGYALRWVIKIV